MPRFVSSSDYRHTDTPKLGVLLTNLGTPEAPKAGPVRRYLREFLSDPRVVEVPRVLWWLILNCVILVIRPRRSAEAYGKIWSDEGSPLLVHAQAQCDAVEQRLKRDLPGRVEVSLGMRYGRPAIGMALRELKKAGIQRLLVLPLYPQYSASTTGSTFDAVSTELKKWRWVPDLRFIARYHDEPGYIAALAASIQEHWDKHGRGERLLFSFHGLPQKYLDKGDPYHCQCHKTARLVAESLDLPEARWHLAFQSRVGAEPWLKPYTDEVLQEWGQAGMGVVDVVCPGFSADCLETLEEIAMQNAEMFEEAGGKSLRYIDALNERADHIDFLTQLIMRNLAGWPEAATGYDTTLAASEAVASNERARKMGSKI
ncbi:MAG: ferrochelatase [Gammaproteobacteria bacterium]|nr:ferrochelatase [Gammaproteobacteria bacterium]